MKKVVLMLSALIMLMSCEKEDLNYKFKTKLIKKIEVSKEDYNTAVRDTVYQFDVEETFKLSDNDKVQEYIDKIEEFEIQDVSCVLSGLGNGQEVSTLNIIIEKANINWSFSGIQELEINLPKEELQAKLNKLATVLQSGEEILIKVNGEIHEGPIPFDVTLTFGSSVTTTITE